MESKHSRLPVGTSGCSLGLICREIPFWFWTTASLGSVNWIDSISDPPKGEDPIHRDWVLLKLAKPREKTWGRKKRGSECMVNNSDSTMNVSDDLFRYLATRIVFFDEMAPGPHHPVWKTPN